MLQYTQIDCAYTVKHDTFFFDFPSHPLVKRMKRLQEMQEADQRGVLPSEVGVRIFSYLMNSSLPQM